MKLSPSCHEAHAQVIFDDVFGEGSVVIEGTVVDHMACSYPVVGKLVEVTPATYH